MSRSKGDRVITPHGGGIVEGFEHFDGEGKSLPISALDMGGRVVVRLDNPENWACHITGGSNPYYWPKELQ